MDFTDKKSHTYGKKIELNETFGGIPGQTAKNKLSKPYKSRSLRWAITEGEGEGDDEGDGDITQFV